MTIALLYWVLSVSCWLYALRLGGSAARWAFVLFLVMTASTVLASWREGGPVSPPDDWQGFHHEVFIGDLIYFLGLSWLALKSRHHWTIWSAGFALLPVLTHLGPLLTPQYDPKVYRGLASVWQLPILATMLIGITKDWRHERWSRSGQTAQA